jgi:hypothetical protein
MAAPERVAEMPDFSLALRAPSIQGTYEYHAKLKGAVPLMHGRDSKRIPPLKAVLQSTVHGKTVRPEWLRPMLTGSTNFAEGIVGTLADQ